MDPEYVDSDEDAEAMAKAMGFSSFGTQGPAKKRKYNHSVDAVVEGQDLPPIDKGGKKGQGSGGNQIPLGKPRVLGVSATKNVDEITLNIDEDDEEDEQPAYVDMSLASSVEQGTGGEYTGPAYLDTSLPPPNEETRAAQEKIDAILAKADVTTLPPDVKTIGQSREPGVGQGVSQYLSALQSVLHPPPPGSAVSTGAGTPNIESHRPAQRGQQNALWYVGYYDQNFNENPWARLEKERGLESKGNWLETAARAV